MGDRGNIIMKMEGGKSPDVYFYTHWRGFELPGILQVALSKGRDRWSDESYLARIIFQSMLNGDNGNTGFGISTYEVDNEYPILVVDSEKGKVSIKGKRVSWSFDDYLKLDLSHGIEQFLKKSE